MKHPVSGEVKAVSKEEFFGLFDPIVHERLEESAKLPGTAALVCFENLQMDSMSFGCRTAMAMGPGRSSGLEAIESGARLGDVPSRFQYPTKLWYVSES